MDLSTDFLGHRLENPLVIGASPLSDDADQIRRLVDAGAAAVVMHSLFMEQLVREQLAVQRDLDLHSDTYAEALSFFPEQSAYSLGPEEYLEQVARLKAAVPVPVIASLNGTTRGDWTRYASLIAQAGADGLELNIYYLPLDGDESPDAVEQRTADILREVKAQVDLPVAMKLTYFMSSPVYTARRLEAAGADSLVLFNRLFQPDIDIEALEVNPSLQLSSPAILKLRLLWLAAMYGKVGLTLAASGGVHGTQDVIKAVMAGASVVQLTSALLAGGVGKMATLRQELEAWLVEHEYESLRQMRGSMSLLHCPDPEAYERANYIKTLQTWKALTR